MKYYCTLFDKNYLAKGLAMYESLRRHSREEFVLFILFMDDESDQIFSARARASQFTNLIAVSRHAFEAAQNLSTCKLDRTWVEYCWTCASHLMDYLLSHHDLPELTYLDADLFFFSDPAPVHAEIGERGIGIIPHRLIPSKRHLEVNGKFNVGWVHAKNKPDARQCIARWAWQVHARCDASTCGDQKYLDEWPQLYGEEVCIIQNIGANVAPWNLANYRLIQKDDLFLSDSGCRCEEKLIFYHFHEFLDLGFNTFKLTNYALRREDSELIYDPYLKAYREAKDQINALHSSAGC